MLMPPEERTETLPGCTRANQTKQPTSSSRPARSGSSEPNASSAVSLRTSSRRGAHRRFLLANTQTPTHRTRARASGTNQAQMLDDRNRGRIQGMAGVIRSAHVAGSLPHKDAMPGQIGLQQPTINNTAAVTPHVVAHTAPLFIHHPSPSKSAAQVC